jgi:2-oxoglutarate ferredoxin oxidoreductase subunit delta
LLLEPEVASADSLEDGVRDTVATDTQPESKAKPKRKPQMGYIVIHEQRCKGCDLCIPACPVEIISKVGPGRVNLMGWIPVEVTDMTRCIACNLCAMVCPDQAIDVFRFARPIKHEEAP